MCAASRLQCRLHGRRHASGKVLRPPRRGRGWCGATTAAGLRAGLAAAAPARRPERGPGGLHRRSLDALTSAISRAPRRCYRRSWRACPPLCADIPPACGAVRISTARTPNRRSSILVGRRPTTTCVRSVVVPVVDADTSAMATWACSAARAMTAAQVVALRAERCPALVARAASAVAQPQRRRHRRRGIARKTTLGARCHAARLHRPPQEGYLGGQWH
mmetsp:Transcript_121745/g.351514  ORF Transcript_121745/g.351514 Transcript_121745/m.351514 type:complete len:219 (-) Transcript_121745:805-1461(-)